MMTALLPLLKSADCGCYGRLFPESCRELCLPRIGIDVRLWDIASIELPTSRQMVALV